MNFDDSPMSAPRGVIEDIRNTPEPAVMRLTPRAKFIATVALTAVSLFGLELTISDRALRTDIPLDVVVPESDSEIKQAPAPDEFDDNDSLPTMPDGVNPNELVPAEPLPLPHDHLGVDESIYT